MITTELKNKILAELKERRKNFHDSDGKFAVSLGINPGQYSRIMKGEIDKVLSDENWITIARRLEVNLKGTPDWKTAHTPVYKAITNILNKCQRDSISIMICDAADIGKTYTAKQYVRTAKRAVHIDCSQVKTKQKLVRLIAKEFGVGNTGRYSDVYEDLVYYLKTIPNPLIILDEAGDLDYAAFLELKALWNATEGCCGWVMMGADGLKEKVRRAIDNKKVGYTEIFRRYGKRYQRITPEGKEDADSFFKEQAALIIRANAKPGTDVRKVLAKTEGSLTRINIELSKVA